MIDPTHLKTPKFNGTSLADGKSKSSPNSDTIARSFKSDSAQSCDVKSSASSSGLGLVQVSILGSTGSIGCNTLAVIKAHPDKFSIFALSGAQNHQLLLQQCLEFKPRFAVLCDEKKAAWMIDQLNDAGLKDITVLSAAADLLEVSSHQQVDVVVSAIVGSAGLLPTMAALTAGKKVLLANKESLVMAGDLMMKTARLNGATIFPVDSEHNAIFQCLSERYRIGYSPNDLRTMTLTASGGPFYVKPGQSAVDLAQVTPEQAIAHPNWSMGKKISVDSATMANKALELIEAFWLFDVAPTQLQVVIHPESIVHSLVSFIDGSSVAQLGVPDMKTPIAYALAKTVNVSRRMSTQVEMLDLVKIGTLSFFEPDYEIFTSLKLMFNVLATNPSFAVYFNAANEIAVENFLKKEIRFDQIPACIDATLQALAGKSCDFTESIEAICEQHVLASNYASDWCTRQDLNL